MNCKDPGCLRDTRIKQHCAFLESRDPEVIKKCPLAGPGPKGPDTRYEDKIKELMDACCECGSTLLRIHCAELCSWRFEYLWSPCVFA